MHLSLHNHSSGYSLTAKEALFSVATLSGLSYAKRHWELAHQSHFWSHRTIAVLECLPVLGALVALIERILAYIFYKLPPKKEPAAPKIERPVVALAQTPGLWKPRILHVELAIAKMCKNAQKALDEHRAKSPELAGEYGSIELGEYVPLTISHEASCKAGRRKTMEDALFFKEIKQGTLAGVFDGHGGDKVALFACDAFQARFADALENTRDDNPRQAFETLFYEINEEILKNSEFKDMGSTAVLSFIEKDTGFIYTATLGDSESTIYRKKKAIPLSCVRDWAHPKEAKRAYEALSTMGDYEHVKKWPQATNPKHLRFPFPHYGVNVSRALGDKWVATINDKPGVIAKPKITMCKLHPGDRVVLACDGLKDYVDEREMNQLMNSKQSGSLAETLVAFAINEKKSQDNVSVIVLTA